MTGGRLAISRCLPVTTLIALPPAQGLLLCCGSIQAALPILAATFAAVIACWLRAVNTLGTTIKVSPSSW